MTFCRMTLLPLLAFLALPTLVSKAMVASATQAQAPAAEARSEPEQLTADTQRLTGGGASFVVPGGWSIVTGRNLVILQPPEPDTHSVVHKHHGGAGKP